MKLYVFRNMRTRELVFSLDEGDKYNPINIPLGTIEMEESKRQATREVPCYQDILPPQSSDWKRYYCLVPPAAEKVKAVFEIKE